MRFKNRAHAGQIMAEKLIKYKNKPDTFVIALPRGGVVNGYFIAQKLNLPLDIIVTKKIPAPDNPEFAIGSVNMDGSVFLDDEVARLHQIPTDYIKEQSSLILKKIKEKVRKLKGNTEIPKKLNKTIILVDDGLATGNTVKAAIQFLKKRKAKKIILAVPVSPPDTFKEISKMVDEIYCLYTPSLFGAIGAFYDDFGQTSDEEAKQYLEKRQKEIQKI